MPNNNRLCAKNSKEEVHIRGFSKKGTIINEEISILTLTHLLKNGKSSNKATDTLTMKVQNPSTIKVRVK